MQNGVGVRRDGSLQHEDLGDIAGLGRYDLDLCGVELLFREFNVALRPLVRVLFF